MGYVFIAAAEKAKVVSHPTAKNQIHLVFETNGLRNLPDVILKVLLIEPVQGPWPNKRYSLCIQSYQTR